MVEVREPHFHLSPQGREAPYTGERGQGYSCPGYIGQAMGLSR